RNKIASFCDVEPEAVIESLDVKTIYSIPLNVQKQNMDQIVLDHFDVQAPKADMSEWIDLEHHVQNLSRTIKIAMVGKCVALQEIGS
ncbi:CTP synthase, partial [Xylella fastidiosa subsp. multiplex]|nr:CTP synthase [Xylella fastidiosa subsp. multiplex]